MSYQSLPSEILIQIIISATPSTPLTAESNIPSFTALSSLRQTCRRLASLITSNASYLAPLLLPPLLTGQTYQNITHHLPSYNTATPDSHAVLDLITHLSRQRTSQSIITRIQHAADLESKLYNGIHSGNITEYTHAISNPDISSSVIRSVFTISDILSLPSCPSFFSSEATTRPQGWRTYLLQQQLKCIPNIESLDILIAMLFAESTLLIHQRRRWLETISTHFSQEPSPNPSIGALAEELLSQDSFSLNLEAPTYAYASLQKFNTAELLLSRGPRWFNTLLSHFETQDSELKSPLPQSSDLEERMRELLHPLDEIRINVNPVPEQISATSEFPNPVPEYAPPPSEPNSSTLPLLKLIWKERERKAAWVRYHEKQKEKSREKGLDLIGKGEEGFGEQQQQQQQQHQHPHEEPSESHHYNVEDGKIF